MHDAPSLLSANGTSALADTPGATDDLLHSTAPASPETALSEVEPEEPTGGENLPATISGDGSPVSDTTLSWTPKATPRKMKKDGGLQVTRRFTKAGEDVFDSTEWELRTAAITGEDGKAVFEQHDCEIPKAWSQLATNVVVSKYFRGPMNTPRRETSVRQVIGRVADTFHKWGLEGGYFASTQDAQAFRDELAYLLLHQYGSFNSPVWFNIGVEGAKQQASACFINSVHDNMESIMELAATEARLFKGGSGAGSNLSRIRSSKEMLSGGGIASGPVSFMRGWDSFAGAIKSGGTTRRAAKMVILDAVHPDIKDFIHCKADEEKKAWALIEAGYNGGFNVPGGAYDSVAFQNANHSVRVTDEFMRAAENNADWSTRKVLDGAPVETHSARQLLHDIAEATHICGDPGLQYDTTINDWHTSANTDRIYASNPCCITGDTLIAVADGRNAVPIRDLVGSEVPVFAHDHATGKTTISRMWNIEVKRRDVAVYRVTLDDGSSFRATDDHLIMLRDGSYRMVRDLKPHDSLMPFHSKILAPQKSRTKRRYIWNGATWTPQYRAIWESVNGMQPPSTHIHHADFDALNDVITNLVLMDAIAHNALHTEKMRGDNNPARRLMNDAWRSAIARAVAGENNPHYGKSHSLETRRVMQAKAAQRWSNPQERVLASQRAQQWMNAAREEGRAIGRPATKEIYQRSCPVCRHHFETKRIEQIFCGSTCRNSPMGYAMSGGKGGHTRAGTPQSAENARRAALTGQQHAILQSARLLMDNGVAPTLERWEELRPQLRAMGVARVPAASTVARHFADDAALQEATTHFNHKVVSVEYSGQEDVYDGTVDTHHNFAIFTSSEESCAGGHTNFSGIFIHNSEFVFLDDTACVAASTRISTPDGLRTAEELWKAQQRGEAVQVTTDIHSENDHRRLAAHRRAWVTKIGERETFRIRLADGRRITATGDHRFLCDDGKWRRVDAMRVNLDRIHVRQSGNSVAFKADESETERWQMLGWLSGDGVFSRGNVALVFGAHEEETARRMEGAFNALIAEAYEQRAFVESEFETALVSTQGAAVQTLPRQCRVGAQANGVLQMTSKSQALVAYLEDWYGFAQGTAIHKDVPSAVHRIADDLKVAYLQGLFSADGCIRHDVRGNEEVMLASSSEEMLRSIQLLLSDLGITSRIGWTHPQGRKNPQGQLHIYNQQARTFLSLIGFPCSQSKHERAQEILNTPFAGAKKNPRPARVLSIEPAGVQTVYDITEPRTHSFIAEGLVTHNCNLASLNLMKYRSESGEFDAETFIHACEIFITAQEIIVSNASYPTEKIAHNSEEYRPLGLGYANLGALLMAQGTAYDSDEGRSLAGAITAIMTGAAYRQSAKIAGNIGPFAGYAKNREPMLRVISKHRDAVGKINHTQVPADTMNAAHRVWDEALLLGQKHGFRNAQATVLAPTGTIAFMMDCDTTGIEPDIALVKYKKLVGGGLLKIVNQTVPEALRRLGYSPAIVEEIVEYIDANDTIEGAPHLNDDDLKVFDCAFKAQNGTRSIHHMGHIKMMAAAQPFISGAISKTVNVPTEATVEDIMDAYVQSWKLGVKAVAIYRDGSKRTQPLSTTTDAKMAEAKSALEAPRAARRKLPDERQSITHKFSIAGQEGYFTVGLYEDGSPGEIFIKMSKEGSTISGLMDSFAVAVSMCLQYGVPLRVLVNKFSHTRFEPSGFTTNKEIPIAKSLMDYIFRWFDLRFHPNGTNGHLGKSAGHETTAASSAQPTLLDVSTQNGSAPHGDDSLSEHLAHLQQDAPTCTECGTIMVRAGACYKCNNCGTTSGCG